MSHASTAEPHTGTYAVTVVGEGLNVEKQIDVSIAVEVIAMVMGTSAHSASTGTTPGPANAKTSVRSTQKKRSSTTPSTTKSKRGYGSNPSVVKDLSLHPKGKKSFADFAAEKLPKTHQQRQVVAVYWLEKEAEMASGITVDHINTCYKAAGWKRPNNLDNSVSVTSVKKGWLDTSDGSNIKLTVPGEDFVTHELPHLEKK